MIEDVVKLSRHQTYLGNPKLKREAVSIAFTQEQIDEYVKCRDDISYFVRNYMKITHVDDGLVPFEMWPFQDELLHHLVDNRFSIVNTARQVGKTTTTVAFLLHYILFNDYKSVGILANKGATAREILSRLQLAYEHLPYWLQQGVIEWNKGSIELENGSSILAASTSSATVRGYSFSTIFVDEAAFVSTNIWESFYNSVYPTISSGKHTKIILVSTPNSLNHFYKLFTFAEAKKNDYAPFTVTWEMVPGRDEKWKKETIRNTSEEQFLQEHCCEFLGSTNTLVSSKKIRTLTPIDPIYKDEKGNYKIFKAPVINKEEPKANHIYLVAVDVARGRGIDYSALSVIDITEYPFSQVAVYRSNKISPLMLPDVIAKIATDYNMAYVLIENNDAGEEVCNILNYDLEYENILSPQVGKKFQLGVKTTKSVKRLGCSNFKDMVEKDKLIIYDEDTVNEIAGFVAKGKSYEADGDGHDDLVMGLVIFAWLSSQEFFKELSDGDLRKALFEKNIKSLEEELAPFGHIDNGIAAKPGEGKLPDVFKEDGELWHTANNDDGGFGSL